MPASSAIASVCVMCVKCVTCVCYVRVCCVCDVSFKTHCAQLNELDVPEMKGERWGGEERENDSKESVKKGSTCNKLVFSNIS